MILAYLYKCIGFASVYHNPMAFPIAVICAGFIFWYSFTFLLRQ